MCKRLFFVHFIFAALSILAVVNAYAQPKPTLTCSIVIINATTNKPLPQASVSLTSNSDSVNTTTNNMGKAQLYISTENKYKLVVTYQGKKILQIDSIIINNSTPLVNLGTYKVNTSTNKPPPVIVYASTPIFETKDGNITYNVGETAVGNSGTATDVLKTAPLITIDAEGKVLLKGKEVKILIDEKPQELNAKQLQDLLEAMPGSSIEKIEILTNPPPQFANERGGVLNIVTKKGKTGRSLRLSTYYGTRGEEGLTAAYQYKKNRWNTQLNTGISYNNFIGNGYSNRTNKYADSVNFFNIINQNNNKNLRPNLRWNTDFDVSKLQSLNLSVNLNQNQANNTAENEYTNLNQLQTAYRISVRQVLAEQLNTSINTTVGYTLKSKSKTGVLKLTANLVNSKNKNDRNFYQAFYTGTYSPTGIDSTQQQYNTQQGYTTALRANYDKLLDSGKYFVNIGAAQITSNTQHTIETNYLKKTENKFYNNPLLSNAYTILQTISSLRAALKYRLKTNHYLTVGTSAEYTIATITLIKTNSVFKNNYLSLLPFVNYTNKLTSKTTLTLVYKKSIQRPGVQETNPAIDYTDPYNLRYGNPYLLPFTAHNVDIAVGKWNKKLFWNLSTGYNHLQNVYATIRTLVGNGITTTTYQNIKSRNEFEASIWGGYTATKNLKINTSIGYTYNQYSSYDKQVLRYRNGASFTSNINANYTPSDVLQYSVAITYNRFANPQGTVRSTVSNTISMQRKLYHKKLTINLAATDPIIQQQNKTQTEGPNFNLINENLTQTRNIRLTLAYLLNNVKPKKK